MQLQVHTGDHVGDVVFMDELIGQRRVRMIGMVRRAVPGHEIRWQLGSRGRLPVRLDLQLTDRDGGVDLQHTITAGWTGAGRVADPLFRLYFTPKFAAAMDAHVHTEFPLLRDRLASPAGDRTVPTGTAAPAEPATGTGVTGEMYLRPTRLLDYRHPVIERLVAERGWADLPTFERIGAPRPRTRPTLGGDGLHPAAATRAFIRGRTTAANSRRRPCRLVG